MQQQLDDLFALIDKANSEDPVLERDSNREQPRALLYGLRMSTCQQSIAPEAAIELRIAARAQHICRWQIARDSYPQGRVGYLKWRRDLGGHHAQLTAELMQSLNFDDTTIERVKHLLQKKNRTHDADTQSLEDIACLVFLKHYYENLSSKHDADKIISILGKTWRKMSPEAQALALELDYPAQQRQLLEAALADH